MLRQRFTARPMSGQRHGCLLVTAGNGGAGFDKAGCHIVAACRQIGLDRRDAGARGVLARVSGVVAAPGDMLDNGDHGLRLVGYGLLPAPLAFAACA